MKPLVVLILALVLLGLRFLRLSRVLWVPVWWLASYVFLVYGIEPPLPRSIILMFMGIITLSLLAYFSVDSQTLSAAWGAIVRFVTDRRYTIPLAMVVVALPAAVGWVAYRNASKAPNPPLFGRTIHPPPPIEITFKGKKINLTEADNPFRALEKSDPDKFRQHVARGRVIYFQNCVFCHGDNLNGEGLFAHGFDPLPANFADPTTIAMLQESYLFWRIAKGGPGLPEESAPWASAMPAWEKFLSEEDIWDVILFLYDYTGYRPRAKESLE
ncbi:MAG: cytochrome c [Calditrichaeota bacterium]|nr:MAG: cytochrome c [Calditrichota bacterium]